MVSICFYFQVHQPFRLGKYGAFDVGNNRNYFDTARNRLEMEKIAKKCYLPANNLLLHTIDKYGEKFKISYSRSEEHTSELQSH